MGVERSAMRKVYWRLLPLTILVYFLCYLDRINVGFAALTMNKDLGLDAATYGMAAGAFFWGYFLFEVPSNIILEKVGARNLDRPHHGDLGSIVGRHGVLRRAMEFPHHALSARPRRGRPVPRHDLILHLLVP